MSILKDSDIEILKKELSVLTGPVKLVNFTQQIECQYCRETNEIVHELTRISDKITAETYNFITDQDAVNKYKVNKIPAIVVTGSDDRGIKFYGIPSGFEFVSLLEAIRMVSAGQSGLSEGTRQVLTRLREPLHLQVFVTPTWPYCPRAVALAHKLAFESPLITADMVEVTEFPHMAVKYQLMGVPMTVINETVTIEGAVPEQMLAQKLEENFASSGISSSDQGNH